MVRLEQTSFLQNTIQSFTDRVAFALSRPGLQSWYVCGMGEKGLFNPLLDGFAYKIL